MIFYFINPYQNHSLGKTVSSMVTFRNTSSKMNFIFDAILKSGNLGVLKNKINFPELPPYFPKSGFFDKIDFKLWSYNKNIKNILSVSELNKSSINDYLFLTTKDTKYPNLFNILSEFRGVVILLLDDHLFSTYENINKIIDHVGLERVKSVSIASIKDNPFFVSMPLSSINETVIGWPISERFKTHKEFSQRLNRVLALGTLTYRQFDKNLMKQLDNKKLNCVHPDREYIYLNQVKSKYIDSKIPMRDYRFEKNSFLEKFFKRISNKYNTIKYTTINLPKVMNNYKFIIYPPLFNQLPCLGMLEAMSSGAILIGTNTHAYNSLGLVDNLNFISTGEKMNIKIIDEIVEDEFKNQEKYLQIQKNSLNWVQKFKKSNFLKEFDLKKII